MHTPVLVLFWINYFQCYPAIKSTPAFSIVQFSLLQSCLDCKINLCIYKNMTMVLFHYFWFVRYNGKTYGDWFRIGHVTRRSESYKRKLYFRIHITCNIKPIAIRYSGVPDKCKFLKKKKTWFFIHIFCQWTSISSVSVSSNGHFTLIIQTSIGNRLVSWIQSSFVSISLELGHYVWPGSCLVKSLLISSRQIFQAAFIFKKWASQQVLHGLL